MRNLIEGLKRKPTGKKHIVSAWNPGDVPDMSLPPCHVMYQMTSDGSGNLDLQLYQRSCDQFLGVPFNIASYAMLTQIIAQELDLRPRRFIHTFGDSHFYTGLEKRTRWYKEHFEPLRARIIEVEERGDGNYLGVLNWINENCPSDGNEEKYDHLTAILEQLSRKPKELPEMNIAKKPFDELTFEDFSLEGYEHHPAIRRTMAV